MFSEDKFPACRCTAHPTGRDKKAYMYVAKEEKDYTVFCCKLCTEISKVPTIQVQFTPRGKAKAAYEGVENEREKRRLLGSGKRPKVGSLSVSEAEES